MTVELRIDARPIVRLENLFRAAGKKAPHAYRRALNHTLDKTYTAVVRALVKQTSAKRTLVRAALKKKRANYRSLEAKIVARGPYIPLKQFNPRQFKAGTRAKVWGKMKMHRGAFMGPRPGVVAAGLHGHVWKRTSSKRLPIEKLYGPAIPAEMVKDESAATFHRVVEDHLPERLRHELLRLLKG